MKALPDTAKWDINKFKTKGYNPVPNKTNKANSDTTKKTVFFEPMINMYFWHPAYNDYPVVNVSREGAKMYCDWLTNVFNEKIKSDNPKEKWESLFMNDLRLPAEEEWMIAARGGKVEAEYPWEINSVQNAKGCFLCNFGIIKATDKIDTTAICDNALKQPSFAKSPARVGSMVFDGAFTTAKVGTYNPNDFGLYNMSGNVAEMVLKFKSKIPATKKE